MLLADPQAQEWQHKVDPCSPTRLLLSQEWVLKTRDLYRGADLDLLRQQIGPWVERTERLGVWHPAKNWFILYSENLYWPCNATPRLTTIVEIEGFQRRANLLRYKQLTLIARTLLAHHILLDMNDSNYGIEGGCRSLFYVDDEVYYFARPRDMLSMRYQLLP